MDKGLGWFFENLRKALFSWGGAAVQTFLATSTGGVGNVILVVVWGAMLAWDILQGIKGNWDWGFHYKYSTKSKKELVSGALRVEEDNSFLAKLINVPEYIELEYFDKTDSSQFYVIGETDDLEKVDISNRELVIKETPTSLTGIINLNNTLTRFLIEDGISAKFTEYLSNNLIDSNYTYDKYIGNFNNITDYIKQYIKLNILTVYDIDTNEFYAKPQASISATNTQSTSNPNGIEFNFLTDRERFVQGYTILKSLQINKKDRLILRFKLDKKPGSGLSISPIIKIKFINMKWKIFV